MNIGRAAKRGGPIVIGLVLVGFGAFAVGFGVARLIGGRGA